MVRAAPSGQARVAMLPEELLLEELLPEEIWRGMR